MFDSVRTVRRSDDSPPGPGWLGVGQRPYLPLDASQGRLTVNPEGLTFEGLRPELFGYGVGGHRVLGRWLRVRIGRLLLPPEEAEFCRIATALDLTLEVQARLADAGTDWGDAS